MSDVHPRHRFGGYALILSLVAILVSGIAYGSTWATVHTEEDVGGSRILLIPPTTITFDADVALRDMEIAVNAANADLEMDESMTDTETHEENAARSKGNVSQTFEEMDSAGATAEWLIIGGIVLSIATLLIVFLSLAGIAPIRPALLTAGIGAGMLFAAPIAWFLMLPSDGAFTNPFIQFSAGFFGEEQIEVSFDPSPAFGFFLAVFGAIASLAMAAMVVKMERSESVEEKPGWMVPREGEVLPEPTIAHFISREGGNVSFDFSALPLKPSRLAMPVFQVMLLALILLLQGGAWANYTIEDENGSADISFLTEEVEASEGGETRKSDYGAGFIGEGIGEIGEVISSTSTALSIASTLLILGLLWRFGVATGFAQRLPALCRHHRILDTVLMTGGTAIAFGAMLYFMIQAPSQAELFAFAEGSDIEGGNSLLVWAVLLTSAPIALMTYTLGEHGAPARRFLRSFDIPLPGSDSDDVGTSTEKGAGMTFVNPFKDPRVTSLPWLMILGVTFTLIIASAGGFMVYKLVVPDPVPPVQRDAYYQNSSSYFGNGSDFESVYVQDGQTETVTYTAMEYDLSSNYSMLRLVVVLDYTETDSDTTCDNLEATFSQVPAGLDSGNSTLSGTVSDCSQVELFAYIERGMEGKDLHGTQANFSADERDALLEYHNDHILGIGDWAVDITVNDQGISPFENGEDVDVSWYIEQVTLTLEPV